MRRPTSTELNELSQRVAAWRESNGGRRARIPEQLWQDAVRVAAVVGVWPTAKATRFNYEALRDRVKQAGGGRAVGKPRAKGGAAVAKRGRIARANGAAGAVVAIAGPVKRAVGAPNGSTGASFIELEMGQLGGAGRTVIDLVDRHGDRMRVDLAGGVDVVGLVRSFWSRGS